MDDQRSPGLLRYVIGFLVVGICWGFTTPFLRRAARNHQPKPQSAVDPNTPWIQRKLKSAGTSLMDYISRPAYTIPLLINLSGSALFFIIVGQAELSLTVPITNSLSFLFTVLGEWVAEGKSISIGTWIGMAFVLTGTAVCVQAKIQQI